MTDLILPTIHMNGTSKAALLEQCCDAIDAMHTAGKALAQFCPNGRDYYPQGPAATGKALDQHEARMKKLRDIIAELEKIGEHISDAR